MQIDIREWGPLSADATNTIQTAINNAPSKSVLFFPAGEYLCGPLVVPDFRQIHIAGAGAILRAAPGTTRLLDVGQDTSRAAPLVIQGLEFQGTKGCTGIFTAGRTNVKITACSFKYFDIGVDFQIIYNGLLDTCVFERNTLGIKYRQTLEGGGGNANVIQNCEFYLNQVGALFDGSGSRFPLENNTILGSVFQNNHVCGLAAKDCGNLTALGTHFEANGQTEAFVIDEFKIKKSNIHLHASSAKLISCSPAYTDPHLRTEAGCVVSIDGCQTYGTPHGKIVEDDGTGAIHATGWWNAWGSVQAKLYTTPDFLQWFDRFSFSTLPISNESQIPENLCLTRNVPIPFGAIDAQINKSKVQFTPEKGSPAHNRVLFDTQLGILDVGDEFCITLLVQSDQDIKLFFNVTDGNYVSHELILHDRFWRKLVLLGRAGTVNSPYLYVYPTSFGGANVYFANMQTVKTRDDTYPAISPNRDLIRDIVKRNLYNPKQLKR